MFGLGVSSAAHRDTGTWLLLARTSHAASAAPILLTVTKSSGSDAITRTETNDEPSQAKSGSRNYKSTENPVSDSNSKRRFGGAESRGNPIGGDEREPGDADYSQPDEDGTSSVGKVLSSSVSVSTSAGVSNRFNISSVDLMVRIVVTLFCFKSTVMQLFLSLSYALVKSLKLMRSCCEEYFNRSRSGISEGGNSLLKLLKKGICTSDHSSSIINKSSLFQFSLQFVFYITQVSFTLPYKFTKFLLREIGLNFFASKASYDFKRAEQSAFCNDCKNSLSYILSKYFACAVYGKNCVA